MWEAQSSVLRQKHGITHVLSVLEEDMSVSLDSERHLIVKVKDNESADLISHFPATCEFIDDALTAGGRVLVHCALGLSRSPTVIAAYLIRKRGLSVEEALALIRKSRELIMPNDGFLKQLNEYAMQQRRARRYLSLG
ncbi:protein-tyrosine phosphatase-like protein [Mucidula mucida]|nr:protein-tyrosine phosphatase-like protein [Mucidula mucida]